MKKFKLSVAGIILLILLAIMNIGLTIYNDNQAMPAFVFRASFLGEYRVGDGPWKSIVKGEHIPSTKGTVQLRGTLHKSLPDGEIFGPVENGELVALYFDHLAASVFVNGEEVHVFDSENPQLGNSTCGRYWLVYEYTATETDVFEIHLTNPHAFGNGTAVDKFLNEMQMYSGDDFEFMLSKQSENLRMAGYIVIFTAVVLLGIALFSQLLHMNQSKVMWIVGAMILSAGCFLVVSSTDAYIWNTKIALNTSMHILSIVFYVIFLQMLIGQCLEKYSGKMCKTLITVSGAWTGILILYATMTQSKLYDILPLWILCQVIVSGFLLILCLKNLKHVEGVMKKLLFVFSMALLCLMADSMANWMGWLQGPLCSIFVFVILFVVALFVVLRVFPKSIQATLREKEIQTELEKSKTAIMLSQIQPHFLYNSLGAIRELCRQDPEDAREALRIFITYLRANMESIQREHMIHFSKELEHISAYLQLEKLRFGDDLMVEYDIQEDDFFIPSLTIQPLIENAVKHGLCGREEGGTVTLHTHREGERIVITIQDDGVGFNVEELDEKEHLGLNNVQKRLKNIVDGDMNIVSELNVGTVVTITIKERGWM